MSEITSRARTLRNNQTFAEKVLWKELRSKKMGHKFRRQYPIIYFEVDIRHCYIADFACLEKKLIIEIDGDIHNTKKNYDKERTYIINNLGFNVLRFNNDMVFNGIQSIINQISLNLLPSP